jgi:hypothetical protein
MRASRLRWNVLVIVGLGLSMLSCGARHGGGATITFQLKGI